MKRHFLAVGISESERCRSTGWLRACCARVAMRSVAGSFSSSNDLAPRHQMSRHEVLYGAASDSEGSARARLIGLVPRKGSFFISSGLGQRKSGSSPAD